ncbi:glycosyltransferase [uncultured Dokdonia sp.]|uniref:glycosyltransferase family 2 protein n=1 Tax=uncultured Dokdonia sp. TaxID=575653 RepID=UPI002618BE58|nr:glycosyltransferase [uncultured Dokdonia sp.]
MNKTKTQFLPLVSIQILNWNRASETQEAIESAYNQSYSNFEVILIDNGSTDNSVELSRKNFPNLKIVELDKNYGCPGGRNLGIDYCKGDYIFFLDNDGVLHKEAVENAINNFKLNEKLGIVTGTIYDFVERDEINATCDIEDPQKYYTNNFQGGICVHKKEIYDKTGLYPSHFMYGAEEKFLTYKLFEANYDLIKDTSVILWHKKSSVARNNYKEQTHSYFNKLYVAVTLYPLLQMIFFVLLYTPLYMYYSYKNGFFKYFVKGYIKDFTNTLRMGSKHRNPISTETYKRIKNFKPISINENL